jgi:beta-lactam-binding protein with PASTA domain
LIFDQDPTAGTLATPGTNVDVSVSTGGVVVPNLKGLTHKAAEGKLLSVGLRAGRMQEASSAEPNGYVFDQNPQPGVTVPAATGVTLSVSSGPSAVSHLVIPDVRGEDVEQATEKLNAAGFKAGRLISQASSKPDGIVIGQDPLPLSQSAPGKAVLLFVSKTNVISASPIEIPDVSGMTLSKAADILASYQLIPQVANGKREGVDAWRVSTQIPTAHTPVQPDTTIMLTLAPPPSKVAWTLAGLGTLGLLAGAYGIGKKRALSKMRSPSQLRVISRRDLGQPHLIAKVTEGGEEELRFRAVRDLGRQTLEPLSQTSRKERGL